MGTEFHPCFVNANFQEKEDENQYGKLIRARDEV